MQAFHRRIVVPAALGALALGLVGTGIQASFTDRATTSESVSVGTFGIEVSATQQGAVVSPDKHSVTFTVPTIMASAASSAPFQFTVKSTGSIPALIHVTQTAPLAPFTSLLANPVADVTLDQNETQVYDAGLSWPELTNADLGKTTSITYTIDATEVASGPALPPIGTLTRVGDVVTIRIHTVTESFQTYTIVPGDTLSFYYFNTPFGQPAWVDNLATADADGVIYYTGTVRPGTPVGQIQVTVKHLGALHSFTTRL
jgi:hypothetical protein